MRLEVGGIARGFAADEAQAALRIYGITPAARAAVWIAREGPAGVERVEPRFWKERGGRHAATRVP